MYNQEFKLNDNEMPAKINSETGEVSELKQRRNNIPKDKEKFEAGFFNKTYTKTWDFLLEELKPIELKIVLQMSNMARMNSNSLNPLNDTTSIMELSEHFGIPRNNVTKIFKKLMKLGVYAEFKFYHYSGGFNHYWVLNPYISFKGKIIDKGIADLFRKTKIARLYQE